MSRSRMATLLASALFSTLAHADFVGLNIASGYWNPDLTGTFSSSSSNDSINVGNALDPKLSFTVSFEHPIPLLPNIKFQNRGLSSSGADATATNISFNGKTFTNGISSTLDLSHNDLVLYYELLDNWVNLDLGLNLKTFDGAVTVSDNIKNESITIDETIPLLYVSARFDLPFTGFYVGADIQNLSLNNSSVEDSSVKLGFEASSGFGIEGGYKKFSVNLNDVGQLNTALKYDGLFINGYFHF